MHNIEKFKTHRIWDQKRAPLPWRAARCPWRWVANTDVHGHDYDTDPRFLRTKVITRDRSARCSLPSSVLAHEGVSPWVSEMQRGTRQHLVAAGLHDFKFVHALGWQEIVAPVRAARWDCEAFCHATLQVHTVYNIEYTTDTIINASNSASARCSAARLT